MIEDLLFSTYVFISPEQLLQHKPPFLNCDPIVILSCGVAQCSLLICFAFFRKHVKHIPEQDCRITH